MGWSENECVFMRSYTMLFSNVCIFTCVVSVLYVTVTPVIVVIVDILHCL